MTQVEITPCAGLETVLWTGTLKYKICLFKLYTAVHLDIHLQILQSVSALTTL